MYRIMYIDGYTTLMNPFAKVVKDDLLFSLATLVFLVHLLAQYLASQLCAICVGKSYVTIIIMTFALVRCIYA